MFHRARSITPCCLVFEDIDAMITTEPLVLPEPARRLGSTRACSSLATTNHPERLDPAIVERPSRFDRKYHFDLPGPTERAAYLARGTSKLGDVKITTRLEKLVDATEEFSFAYLKELYLSAMMRWMRERKAGGMAEALGSQAAALREQMKTGAPAQAATTPGEGDAGMAAFLGAMRRRR